MITIYKYPLELDVTTLELPQGANCVHVAAQNGKVCIWVLQDTSLRTETRRFKIVGTGHEITDEPHFMDLNYVGTAHIDPFVWHVIDLNNE